LEAENILSKNKVAIIVPIYKNELTDFEIRSIKILKQYLSSYTIYAVGPKSISRKYHKFNFLEFDSNYFKNIPSYSKLLLSSQFYERFENYKYVLIYQIDCLIFSSGLEKWCELGYDYIGAPFFRNKYNPMSGFSRVGNGGLSLRKVESFLKVLNSEKIPSWLQFIKNPLPDRPFWDVKKRISVLRQVQNGIKWYSNQYSLNEDLFWSDRAKLFYPDFKVAPIDIGLKFAFEAYPRYCYEKNNYKLPFGAHAWEKWDKTFWDEKLFEKN